MNGLRQKCFRTYQNILRTTTGRGTYILWGHPSLFIAARIPVRQIGTKRCKLGNGEQTREKCEKTEGTTNDFHPGENMGNWENYRNDLSHGVMTLQVCFQDPTDQKV